MAPRSRAGGVQGVEQPAAQATAAVVGIDADVVDPGRDTGGTLSQLDPRHADSLVVHHRRPQVHVRACQTVGEQLGELPRRLRHGRLGVEVPRLRDVRGVVAHRLRAPGVVLLRCHRTQREVRHGRGRPSAPRARAARRRGGRCGPSGRSATRWRRRPPRPRRSRCRGARAACWRTAAESTPSGTLTVVSSGRRLPSAANSSRPISWSPSCSSVDRPPGGAPRRPRAPPRGSGSGRRAG